MQRYFTKILFYITAIRHARRPERAPARLYRYDIDRFHGKPPGPPPPRHNRGRANPARGAAAPRPRGPQTGQYQDPFFAFSSLIRSSSRTMFLSASIWMRLSCLIFSSTLMSMLMMP